MESIVNQNPEIIQHLLNEDERYPNNATLPLLIYKNVLTVSDANAVEQLFADNDWRNAWKDDIYTYHHYHSNTHEVLGVFSGHCIVQFGGDHGITEELRVGDVVIIPAGVAHKKIAGENFTCVGAYPGGAEYNLRFGASGELEQSRKDIKKVPMPEKDPVFGKGGPLKSYWNKKPAYAH